MLAGLPAIICLMQTGIFCWSDMADVLRQNLSCWRKYIYVIRQPGGPYRDLWHTFSQYGPT